MQPADSDQCVHMHRLIWVFPGYTGPKINFLTLWLICSWVSWSLFRFWNACRPIPPTHRSTSDLPGEKKHLIWSCDKYCILFPFQMAFLLGRMEVHLHISTMIEENLQISPIFITKIVWRWNMKMGSGMTESVVTLSVMCAKLLNVSVYKQTACVKVSGMASVDDIISRIFKSFYRCWFLSINSKVDTKIIYTTTSL